MFSLRYKMEKFSLFPILPTETFIHSLFILPYYFEKIMYMFLRNIYYEKTLYETFKSNICFIFISVINLKKNRLRRQCFRLSRDERVIVIVFETYL